jgi:autotransporter-associated beta strand protein
LGGAVFVRQGATVTIEGGSISGGGAFGGNDGTGTDGGTRKGQGIGTGIFLAGSATYNVTAGKTVSISDTIGGGVDAQITGGFTKGGSGTLALSGANSYVGGTTVAAGTLLANNTTGSATGTGVIQVNDTGTLGGTGSVAGAVSVLAGGTLAPGASIGTLNTGTVSLAAGSLFSAEIDAALSGRNADLLNVTGGVSLGGSSLSLAVVNYDDIMGGPMTFLLISNDGSDAISGSFASVMGLAAGYTATLNYAFSGTDALGRVGSGNDVAVTLSYSPTNVPGPLPVLGALAAFGWNRKIRRRIREAREA